MISSVKINGANCLFPFAHISLNFEGWASLYPTINNIAAKLAMGSLFNKLGNNTKLAKTKKPCKIKKSDFNKLKDAGLNDGEIFGFGFKSVNIGNSEIKGFELSIAGDGQIGKTNIQLLGGYTYTAPYIDDTHHSYDEYYNTVWNDELGIYDTIGVAIPISYHSTSSDTSGVLKYRYRHLAKFDINLERNRLSTGFSLRYNSRMENIDRAFIEPIFDFILGTTTAWERLNKNMMILDYRVGYNLTEDARITFNIDNIFNKEQSLRPAALSAPRTYSILLKLIF